MMLKIGITGGIGVGKTTVCKIFSSLGVPIYEADSRAKWLLTNDKDLSNYIQDAFGKEAYLADGHINRQFFATQILGNASTAKHLESLIHPVVRKDFMLWLEQQPSAVPYILKEAALLYETGSFKELDKNIVVTAPLAMRIERVLARDTFRTREELDAIIAKQLPDRIKLQQADFIITNDGNTALLPQVLTIHSQLQDLSKFKEL